MKSRLLRAGVLGLLVAVSSPARGAPGAPTEASPPATPAVEVHGFVSQGFIKTSANNYLANSAQRSGSFEFMEVGINFTSQVTERLRVGMQLFARDLGPIGSYSAKMDWFYLDYRWRDWLGLRAGRVKVPFGLYNDISDIDSARVAVLLPQSTYPVNNRDYLLAQTGMEIYGYRTMGRGGALDYRLYAGSIHLDLVNPPGRPYQITQVTNPFIVGGRLLWETPLEGLRVGGSVQALRLDFALYRPGAMAMDMATMGWARLPAVLWITSIDYINQNLMLAAEYGRWHVRTEISDPALIQPVPAPPEPVPVPPDMVSERGYVMGAYRLTPWLQPGAYYSLFFPNVEVRNGSRATMQHDIAATLRFDINSNWLIKVEGHYMHGTASLQSALNGNVSTSTLTKDWVVGLVKTTAYF